MRLSGFWFLGAFWLAFSPTAEAWDQHASLMPAVLSGLRSGPIAEALDRSIPQPCPPDEAIEFSRLASELKLNPKVTVMPATPEACARREPVTGRDILLGFVADEPDNGMDRNIPYEPEDYDPRGFQKWMGGKIGPSSQGFRHMYFGGWQLWHPLDTFQIPVGAVGMAPQRVATMAVRARELMRSGRQTWGFRLLGWAIHYAQDLAQPFHAVQIPSMSMVPWHNLWSWPPSKAFESLVSETTRTISNYHWAYEEYTRLRSAEERSPYAECLARADEHALLADDPYRDDAMRDPLVLGHRVAKASVRLGPAVGEACVGFFGRGLMAQEVDLRVGMGKPDFAELAVRPDLVEAREELRKVTCIALGDAAWATRALVEWTLRP